MEIFNTTKKEANTNLFYDGSVNIARYDRQKHPWLQKLTEKQLSFYWTPDEIDVYRDAKDFKSLTSFERHIFTSNLKRQIILDSVQGRAPILALGPICSLPELETWLITWSFFETIHSRSYTHIIRNVYPDPSRIFDDMLDIPEIVECAKDISFFYDSLIEDTHNPYGSYESKICLWKCLMSINALEGIRFYVSFACSWAFAELKNMEGNAKIIKLICRDENLHLAGTQQLIKSLLVEDEDYVEIKERYKDSCVKMFADVAEQEKAWARYLFKDGSMIGLNEKLLCDYIEWITHKRMIGVGLPPLFKSTSNPLPWTQKWISGAEVQVAPQEVEISAYQIGNIKQDVKEDSFKGMQL